MEKLLTIKQACAQTGVGRSTIYRENKAGRLPFRKIGRATRIAQSDLSAWIDNLPCSNDCPMASI